MKFSDLYTILSEQYQKVNEAITVPFLNMYPERETYYHGTSTNVNIGDRLLPPNMTDVLSETGRLKNLDKVFFTKDIGSARIYAGRSVQKFGGRPVIYNVRPVGPITQIQDTPGTTVYFSDWAYVIEIDK